MNPLGCPQCQQVDQVLKLSVVADAGTSLGYYSGPTSGPGYGVGADDGSLVFINGWTTLTGSQQTNLSARLSLPVPTYRSPWSEKPDMYGVVLMGFALFFLVFILSLASRSDLVTTSIVCLLIVVGVTVLIAIGKGETASARQAWVAAEYPRWLRAMGTWQQLYYCGRCDGVFLPHGQSPLIPAAQMAAFCYSR